MLDIIEKKLTGKQIEDLATIYEHYIKFVVDIEKNIVAAGTAMHYECEQFLLDKGSE